MNPTPAPPGWQKLGSVEWPSQILIRHFSLPQGFAERGAAE